MGAQQGKEAGGGAGGRGGGGGGGGHMSPHPHQPPMPPMAGRLGERQGSRIKGLRPQKQKVGANVFTEHSGEYIVMVIRQARGQYFASYHYHINSFKNHETYRTQRNNIMNHYIMHTELYHLKRVMIIDYEESSFPLGWGSQWTTL